MGGGNPNFKIEKKIFLRGGRRTGVGEGDLYWTPVTLTYNLRERKNVSNGTCPPQGQQLCKIILKSMHKCTSYGPEKLNI